MILLERRRLLCVADRIANVEAGDGSLLHLGAEVIGPILMGMRKPVHVLQRAVEVADIVNMAAITVVDTQEKAADMP